MQLLREMDLRPITPWTVDESVKIMERPGDTSAMGYALSVAEYFSTDIALGVPILSRTGVLLGGISLSVSSDRRRSGKLK